MTPTTQPGTVPTKAGPATCVPTSWREVAIAILSVSGRPLSAVEIVAAARARGWIPASKTKTPSQSVRRDLHAAIARGDTRVVAGPAPGQFLAAAAVGTVWAPAPITRLPVQPLEVLIAARGGLRACGVRHHPGDSTERTRWVARLQRGLGRARRRGWVSVQAADEFAVALSRHPVEVWPDEWWEIA
jgi:hypothetical protein